MNKEIKAEQDGPHTEICYSKCHERVMITLKIKEAINAL